MSCKPTWIARWSIKPGSRDGSTSNLQWTPDETQSNSLRGPGPPPKPPEGAETQRDLFTAIQQQLGLRLESTTAQTDVLVIDKVEKPSEN